MSSFLDLRGELYWWIISIIFVHFFLFNCAWQMRIKKAIQIALRKLPQACSIQKILDIRICSHWKVNNTFSSLIFGQLVQFIFFFESPVLPDDKDSGLENIMSFSLKNFAASLASYVFAFVYSPPGKIFLDILLESRFACDNDQLREAISSSISFPKFVRLLVLISPQELKVFHNQHFVLLYNTQANPI